MNKQRLVGAAKTVLHRAEKIVPVGPKDITAATSICRKLASRGISSTLGYFHTYDAVPEKLVQEHRRASGLLIDCQDNAFYLSLKPWQLNFDPDMIATIADAAISNRHGIHFDSLQDDLVERSFDLLERRIGSITPTTVTCNGWQYGITLPSRWRRSTRDADRAAASGMRVRVVKGEIPAADRGGEVEPGEGFLTLVDRVAGRVPEIEIATHDYAVARAAVLRSLHRGSSVQLCLLYGFPKRRMLHLAREMEIPVRVYVPYGDSLLYYVMRSFIKNPRKVGSFLTDALFRALP